MLMTKIVADLEAAHLAGESSKAISLTTLLCELQTKEEQGTVMTDDEVVKSIRKLLEGIAQVESAYGETPFSRAEKRLLAAMLPQQLEVDTNSHHSPIE